MDPEGLFSLLPERLYIEILRVNPESWLGGDQFQRIEIVSRWISILRNPRSACFSILFRNNPHPPRWCGEGMGFGIDSGVPELQVPRRLEIAPELEQFLQFILSTYISKSHHVCEGFMGMIFEVSLCPLVFSAIFAVEFCFFCFYKIRLNSS